MQLFFYDLCSKAGDANQSVVPAVSDKCVVTPPGVQQYGVDEVECVLTEKSCCEECLERPWCLSYASTAPGVCSLKDNVRPVPRPGLPPPPPPPRPSDYSPHNGVCGGTSWTTPDVCSGSASCESHQSGAVHARENNITSLEQCIQQCERCERCNFVSFSLANDDCSWYVDCDMSRLIPTPQANYTSVRVRNGSSSVKNSTNYISGYRQAHSAQQTLPSPRYANCIVDGKQVVTPEENGLQVPNKVDSEWFAVVKEHRLADKCRVDAKTKIRGAEKKEVNPSFFWTVMSQNGNAPTHLGENAACLPQCYSESHGGWPPAVNASASRCPPDNSNGRLNKTLGFNGLPMNQPKVMVGYTDPKDPNLRGRFNWTFELDADLSVSEADFPASQSLGIWEWMVAPSESIGDKVAHRGMVRIYQRVSKMYSWICTYFGADAGLGIKGNQAYNGRGMMTEPAVLSLKGPIVKFWLNITKAQIHGSGVASWYAPNMEVCWDQATRKPCRPYGNTNTMVHQQVLLDYGGGDSCTESERDGCPR